MPTAHFVSDAIQPGRKLLTAIHDVAPCFESEVGKLADLLGARLGGPRFAMLVVPNHWGRSPLAEDRGFQRRLREWADAGVEMFVHGWFHLDDTAHRGALARWKAERMTAGEGEFLGLPQGEARRRMEQGRDLVEQVIGRAAAGFIAPAWLYGPGARAALAPAGFALAEDHMRVWAPASDRVLARGPVITWASRSRSRIASSLAFAALARNALGRMDTVRIAVHPGDTGVPSLIQSIDRTVSRFVRTHRPARYADLVTGSARGSETFSATQPRRLPS